jgi:hypothetical protein
MTTDPPATFPVTCPACSKVGHSLKPIPPGAKVRCKCGHAFVPNPVEVEEEVFDLSSAPAATPLSSDQVSVGDLEGGLEEDRLGVEREATLTDVWKVLNSIESSILGVALRGPTQAAPREYKVITQKDKWFSGKFDPDKVEGALNSYAKQGWTLKGVATATVPGFGGQREEVILIMER